MADIFILADFFDPINAGTLKNELYLPYQTAFNKSKRIISVKEKTKYPSRRGCGRIENSLVAGTDERMAIVVKIFVRMCIDHIELFNEEFADGSVH